MEQDARGRSRMRAWDGVGGTHLVRRGEMGSANLGHVVENSVVLEALEGKMEALKRRRVRGATARARRRRTRTRRERARGRRAGAAVRGERGRGDEGDHGD